MIVINLLILVDIIAIGVWAAALLVQPEQPRDVYSFQWIAILALTGVIPVLYWQNVKLRDKHDADMKELTEAYHEVVKVNTISNKEMARALSDMASTSRLENQLAQMEKQLEARIDKRQQQ